MTTCLTSGAAGSSDEPEKHGVWEIVLAADGGLAAVLADDVGENSATIVQAAEAAGETNGMFAMEAHLRDYLAKTLPRLPEHSAPLNLYRTEERDGVEFQTDVGPIDILAIYDGDFYVIELKCPVPSVHKRVLQIVRASAVAIL